jgi:hypothetical protein
VDGGLADRAEGSAKLPRAMRPVLMPAAAVVLVVGGVVAVSTARSGPSGSPLAGADATAATSDPAATTGGPAVTSGGKAVATSGPASASPTSTRVPSRIPPAGGPATRTTEPSSPAEQAKVSVTTVASGTRSLKLECPPLQDWIVTGGRADLEQVHAKAGSGVLAVEAPSSATVEPGKYRITWADGVPEQNHVDADTWLALGADDGGTIVVEPSARSRSVVLYAGARDVRAHLSISAAGLAPTTEDVSTSSPAPQGLVITISLPPLSGEARIRLTGVSAGPSPEVYLSAVTLLDKPA